jgi:hypothetical protein
LIVDAGGGEVWALGATDGAMNWAWREPAGGFRDRPRPEPVFLDLAGGGRGVVVSGLLNDLTVVLDGAGREVQRVTGLLPLRGGDERGGTSPVFLRPLDAGSVLTGSQPKLRLTRGGIEPRHRIWEDGLSVNFGEVLDVIGEGDRRTIVVRHGNWAHGIDAASGKERWRCVGPSQTTGVLPTGDLAAPPFVLFTDEGGATTCRRALAVGEDGRYRRPAGEPITPAPLPEDPRLSVPWPWWQALSDMRHVDWPALLLVQAAVIVAAALGRSAAWVFRRGAWFIGSLLVLLLVVVLAGTVALVRVRAAPYTMDRVTPWLVPLGHALTGLPVLVFVGWSLAWALQGRWRRVGVLLAASVLLTLALAVLIVWADRDNLGPTQHYAVDGWYAAWLPGAYVTGALLVLGWLLRAAFRGLRRGYRFIRPARVVPTG